MTEDIHPRLGKVCEDSSDPMMRTIFEGRTSRRLATILVSLLVALAGCAALALRAADALGAASQAHSRGQVTRAESTSLLFGCLDASLHRKVPNGAAIFIVDRTTFARQRLAEFAFSDYRVVDQATEAEYLVGLSRPRNSECRELSLTVTRR